MSVTNECLTAEQYHKERVAEVLGYGPEPWQLDAWMSHRFHEQVAEYDSDHALDDGTPLYHRRDLENAWRAVEDLARESGR